MRALVAAISPKATKLPNAPRPISSTTHDDDDECDDDGGDLHTVLDGSQEASDYDDNKDDGDNKDTAAGDDGDDSDDEDVMMMVGHWRDRVLV